ncbi:oligoribonuclease [Desulfatibacillum aliphaticivorans]|nr:oligoribonuclease [Desulfatibacillum aliphaticivorans]
MDSRMVWIDMEMTGLNPDNSVIVEIATLITDGDLNLVAEGPELAIFHPPHVLENIDPWSLDQHTASGLLDRVKASDVDTAQAEKLTLDFIKEYCAEKECPLAGNSVWQDRRFMVKYMPLLEDFLLHRMVDVSTIKELFKRWYPDMAPFVKTHEHTALADIMESINELRYYREKVFLPIP